MKVKITCRCNASFELQSSGANKSDYICPSCGRTLPNDSSKTLHEMFAAYEMFEAKLKDSNFYEIEFLGR